MQAVVFDGPFNIVVKERPKPVIIDPTDAILKVEIAGICGSELHMYRGHQETTTGHIMGHEFVGVIESVGSGVQRFKVGQKVMSIFSPMCMQCWFCQHGYTNRCVNGIPFGTKLLDGGQSEYVRVPYADSTLEFIPPEVPDEMMIIMCDIFPTGYYGAMKATLEESVIVCLGCGPVGLCAVMTAVVLGVGTVYAVDSVEDRLEAAREMGAKTLKLGTDDIPAIIKSVTDGRGADAIVESVGNKSGMRLAVDLVRPCGVISSIGFHQSDLPYTGLEAYSKNLDINMGRAAVRPVFGESLKVFADNLDKFSSFITHRIPLSEAPKGYEVFEKHQARKVILLL
ncbi:hypothetical protein ASPZODRAFT_73454 [Penicilliopsis zonata CBS 506.65]|uniref:Enoyl reductase (ER) domain-containing protein n=1 Tax=Penicilliopsis zonata CBS 506.65 TaxID=1073090 RepID=A0A1L9S9R2_9EURO|nr:hypothetical protein ASPZODRAFT_73454 [Penicilliopsis zonata CBS 506.65]OJJ43894.1 hypothetical protein ASPZODRAFT_73454 [Penicilliopsis zonata CBS 506.65]